MHGPDGTDYPNITTYHEIIPYEKLVYDHGGNEERLKLFSVVLTLRADRGKTVMSMRTILPTGEEASAMMGFIHSANGTSTWDRLGEYLMQTIHQKTVFQISRYFPRKCDDVFKAFVSKEHQHTWITHPSQTRALKSFEFREGATSVWDITNGPESHEVHLHYNSLRPNESLSFSQTGGMVSLQVSIQFVTLSPDETRVDLQCQPMETAAEEVFNALRPTLNETFTQSFNQLANLTS